MLGNFIRICADCSWWFETSFQSLILFGESPYPTDDSEE